MNGGPYLQKEKRGDKTAKADNRLLSAFVDEFAMLTAYSSY